MKKIDFITLILSVIGVLVFGSGLSMGLVPEFSMLKEGIIVGVIGLLILLVMVLVRRKMSGKKLIILNARLIGIVIYGFIACLTIGTGITIVTTFQKYIIPGIFMGILGIGLLIYLIPMITSLKD